MMELKVTKVERILLSVPFKEHLQLYNVDLARLNRVELIRVTTNANTVGYGECLPLMYPERSATDSDISRVIGQHPLDFATSPVGMGLQIALLDAAGKALDVPAHALLGHTQTRRACPLAWWSGQLAPIETHIEEAARAQELGYHYHKLKARPWLDVDATVQRIQEATPQPYTVDVDWNQTLRTAADALGVLSELERHPHVGMHESPIWPDDFAGMRRLREQLERPVFDHFTPTAFSEWIRAEAVDGFVATGTIPELISQAILAERADLDCFLQVMGLGITTSALIQLGAVLPGASWPIVTGMNIYARDLLVDPIAVRNGSAGVPDAAGLGVTVDEEDIHRFQLGEDEASRTEPAVRRLLRVHSPDGREWLFTGMEQLRRASTSGDLPLQSPGIRLEIREDDGSRSFATAYPKV